MPTENEKQITIIKKQIQEKGFASDDDLKMLKFYELELKPKKPETIKQAVAEIFNAVNDVCYVLKGIFVRKK